MTKNELNAENPFGIHFLKFIVSVMILAVHGLVFIGIFDDYRFETTNTWMMRLLACFPSTILVPFTAGATQGLLLYPLCAGNRLKNFQIWPIFKILLLLAFLESAKAMILQPSLFFGWNVVHMIAVSLVIVLVLARWSIHAVWISGLLTFLVTPTVREWLRPFQIVNVDTIRMLNEAQASITLLLVLGLIGYVFVLNWLFSTARVGRVYRVRMAAVATVVFSLFCLVVSRQVAEFYFAVRILNLPVGALAGDALGLHFWPIFPWYASVAGGFSLYYWWQKTTRPRLFASALAIVSVVTLVGYFVFYFPSIVSELDPKYFWNSKLFAGNLALPVYGLASFALFSVGCAALAQSRRYLVLQDRYPILFRVPFVYSKTIFWSYFFVNTFGIALAYLFSRLLPTELNIFIFPIVLTIGWYWAGEFVIELLSKRRVSIQLSPASRPENRPEHRPSVRPELG